MWFRDTHRRHKVSRNTCGSNLKKKSKRHVMEDEGVGSGGHEGLRPKHTVRARVLRGKRMDLIARFAMPSENTHLAMGRTASKAQVRRLCTQVLTNGGRSSMSLDSGLSLQTSLA